MDEKTRGLLRRFHRRVKIENVWLGIVGWVHHLNLTGKASDRSWNFGKVVLVELSLAVSYTAQYWNISSNQCLKSRV